MRDSSPSPFKNADANNGMIDLVDGVKEIEVKEGDDDDDDQVSSCLIKVEPCEIVDDSVVAKGKHHRIKSIDGLLVGKKQEDEIDELVSEHKSIDTENDGKL
jgi:hypothetical protein